MKLIPLGQLILPVTADRAGKRAYPILSMTMHNGLVDQANKFKKRVASDNTSQYKVIRRNDLVVGFPIDEGVLSFQKLYDEAIVSPAYDVWRLSDKHQTDTAYLERYLRSPRALMFYRSKLRGTTARRRTLPDDIFLSMLIPLPSLAEQQRIAAILDKADEIRRKREKAIELTDSFLRSVFLEMFGDPVSNPRKWGTVAIREIAKVVTGNTPSRKISSYYGDEIDWIKSDNINTPSHFLTPASERLSLSGKAVGRVVPRNSILITCIAGSPACIGNAAISTREVAFNQQINALVPFSDNCEFIYSLILLGKKLIQSASTNSMKGMVSKGKLEQIKVINPPDSLQQRFRDVFLAHCKHRETLECQLLKIMECQNSLVAHLLYPNNEGLAQRGTASTYETAHAL